MQGAWGSVLIGVEGEVPEVSHVPSSLVNFGHKSGNKVRETKSKQI